MKKDPSMVAVAVIVPISSAYSDISACYSSADLSEWGPQTPELQCSRPGQ